MDENSNADMANLMGRFRQIKNDTGCSFIIARHTRKLSQHGSNDSTQIGRGASSIRGIVDSDIFLRKAGKGLVIIEQGKTRRGSQTSDFTAAIEDLDDATQIRYEGTSEETKGKVSAAESKVTHILADHGGSMLRQAIFDAGKLEALSAAAIIRALATGVKSGLFINTRDGKAARYSLTAEPELEEPND
jgi:hypothetical protein